MYKEHLSIFYGNYFLRFELSLNFIICVFREFQNTQYVILKKFKAKPQVFK